MTELIMLLGIALSGILFRLGGMFLKALRRFVLPICLWGLLVWMGVNAILAGVAMGVLIAVLCLGYGEGTPVWGKILVALSYGVPALIVGFTWWAFIIPPVFLIMFLLSNIPLFQKDFTWGVVEFLTGTLIGCSIMTAGLQPWV